MFDHIFIITTYQYPHLEHMYSDISYLSSKGKKVLVINLINTEYFLRSDLQWRNLRRLFSMYSRNTLISSRVRCILKKIQQISVEYLDKIVSFEYTKIDRNLEKIIFDSASSYISHWENSFFIDNDRAEIFSRYLIKYFSKFYKSFSDIFENNSYALIHLFNGRFPYENLLQNIFLKSHKVLLYECNEFNQKCIRKFNEMHRLNGFSYEINSINKSISSNLKRDFVNSLIDYKRRGKIISKEKFDYIYYSTSLDEYYFTGHTLDQIKFLQKFCFSFPKEAKIAIRVHPNTRNKNSFDKFYWQKFSDFLRSKGARVFSFDEDIDSYSLSNDKSLSFSLGSTIGGELIFQGQYHYFIGDQTPFSIDSGVISLNPNQVEKAGFPVKKVVPKNEINKDLIASSLMLWFFIGEDFEYRLSRKTKNKLYNHMFSIYPELFKDQTLNVGIKQKDLLEIPF